MLNSLVSFFSPVKSTCASPICLPFSNILKNFTPTERIFKPKSDSVGIYCFGSGFSGPPGISKLCVTLLLGLFVIFPSTMDVFARSPPDFFLNLSSFTYSILVLTTQPLTFGAGSVGLFLTCSRRLCVGFFMPFVFPLKEDFSKLKPSLVYRLICKFLERSAILFIYI